ncbi:GAF domain-containing protein [Frondihabitans sp. PAMC 28766]|uniref:GAF domain-containing protein n=1 Tax=Frondihabitans sp. PAMC 28766 TaxID=1795630 RepID=UPI0009E93E5C|nr:GAF domain-containing protein [Frondihabitans sp. PAMC 28766]
MNAPNGVASPDGPTSGLDQVPESSSEGLLDTEKRLRSLLRANRAVIEQLELPVVLRTIVESALELVGARYGGLRVTSDEGGLDEFVHVGAAPDAPSRIGRQPQGLGVLSAIHDEGRPVRIADIEKDLRFMGFPDGHPRFHSFLGVPITRRGAPFRYSLS